jgi:hypothetical protein
MMGEMGSLGEVAKTRTAIPSEIEPNRSNPDESNPIKPTSGEKANGEH